MCKRYGIDYFILETDRRRLQGGLYIWADNVVFLLSAELRSYCFLAPNMSR